MLKAGRKKFGTHNLKVGSVEVDTERERGRTIETVTVTVSIVFPYGNKFLQRIAEPESTKSRIAHR